jgi:hypothetical protein
MKTLCAAALLLCLAACGSRDKASAADCDKACARVADLQLASKRSQAKAALHEIDEEVDRQEEESARNTALLKQQLAEGGPPFNPKAFSKLPARTQRDLAERHKWEEQQLKLQRELALKASGESVATAKKKYEDAKARTEADDQKATAAAVKSCGDSCVQRPAKFAQCLQRTQAVEDLDICEHQ